MNMLSSLPTALMDAENLRWLCWVNKTSDSSHYCVTRNQAEEMETGWLTFSTVITANEWDCYFPPMEKSVIKMVI